MKLIKTAIVTGILVLSGTSAFAGTADTSFNTVETTRQVHIVKAPVLLETRVNTPRKIKRVVIQPVDTLVVRDASTADHSPFVFQTGKHANTKSKMYRPAMTKTKAMPNLFKK